MDYMYYIYIQLVGSKPHFPIRFCSEKKLRHAFQLDPLDSRRIWRYAALVERRLMYVASGSCCVPHFRISTELRRSIGTLDAAGRQR